MKTNSEVSFGCFNTVDGSFQKGYIENGEMKFSSVYEKFFKCLKIDKFIKHGWFGGIKYYVVLKIPELNPSIFTFKANENQYYGNIDKIKMYSVNGHTWVSDKDFL